MNKRQQRKEEKARIHDQNVYGIALLDIKKDSSDNRLFLCLVRAILLFLAVYGTIIGLAASFDLPISHIVVAPSLFILSLFSSFIYYNKITFYSGYVIVFIILIIMAFAFYMYINSGFQAFLNEVISRYETFFSIVSGRVAEEQIANRTVSVSAMLIFVGGVFSIFFNITISGYMDLPMTFIVSFLPLQIAFYIDIVPPMIYLVMLLSVYISVAILGRSGRYTLPYKYKKDIPYGRKRKKNRDEHFYHASGRGMLKMMGISVVLSTIIMLLVGGTFNTDFSTKKISNSVKDITDKYVKTVVVSGITSLFNRYDAVGGLSKGQLGGIRSVNPDYQTDLIIEYVPYSKDDIYLKAYTGVRYEHNRFYNTLDNSPSSNADAIIMGDNYILQDANNNTPYYKMRVENVNADNTYGYQPYIPVLTTIDGSPAKTGISPFRSIYYNDAIHLLSTNLKDNTYETIFTPITGNEKYTIKDLENANSNNDMNSSLILDKYKTLYLSYPSYLNDTLANICNEANLTSEESDSYDSDKRSIMIAEALKRFYENKFNYTMTPGATPVDSDVVEHFLTKNRNGFCAHFASSATLILRYMNIPARYCEGYLLSYGNTTSNTKISDDINGWVNNGTSLSDNGTNSIGVYRAELSDANAHAWLEIYLENYGWVPYEMTPPAKESESGSSNLGFWGVFARLFNPTERLIDDTDGNSIQNDLSDTLSDTLTTNPLNDSSSGSIMGIIKQFVSSVGYLFLPFLWMIIVIIIILIIWLAGKRAINIIRIKNYIKKKEYNKALLLEYRLALAKWKKKKLITSDNPSVREVEESLIKHLKLDGKNNIKLNEEEIKKLMNAVYLAAFSEKGITKEIYYESHKMFSLI